MTDGAELSVLGLRGSPTCLRLRATRAVASETRESNDRRRILPHYPPSPVRNLVSTLDDGRYRSPSHAVRVNGVRAEERN